MNKQILKIGLDMHGVLDNIKFFTIISELLVEAGHEVHIITGREWKKIKNELYQNDIYEGTHYSHHFSITDYLIEQGESVRWEDPDNPWFEEDAWNKVKGEYCEKNKIDIHFDDTEVYASFFKTPIFVRKK